MWGPNVEVSDGMKFYSSRTWFCAYVKRNVALFFFFFYTNLNSDVKCLNSTFFVLSQYEPGFYSTLMFFFFFLPFSPLIWFLSLHTGLHLSLSLSPLLSNMTIGFHVCIKIRFWRSGFHAIRFFDIGITHSYNLSCSNPKIIIFFWL